MQTSNPFKRDATTIGLVGTAHALSHFMQMLLVPLFPMFRQEFDLSYSQIGFLVSVLYMISSLGQASSGFAVDRLGARPVLFASFGLFILAAITAANATGYSSLILVMVLVGIANSPFHPVDFTIMNQRVSSARLGYAFSIHGVTGNLGWALAPVFFVGITALTSWRIAYYAAAALLTAVLAMLIWHKDLLQTQTHHQMKAVNQGDAMPASSSGLGFLKLPAVWWCFGFFMFATMTLAVIQSYATSILHKVHDVSLYAANATLTAYMLCAAAGMMMGGWVAAKFPDKSDLVVARAMTAAAVILVFAASGLFGAIGTCVLIASTGFAIGVGGPSRDMMIKKATPVGATGRVYGLVYSGMDVGFSIAPMFFGLFMDRGYYASVLVGAGVTLMIAVFLALGVGRRTERPTVGALA
ncbi:MAG: MFS transporter [Cytophagales bacterium]|nr:MFS transporter [Cytophagales bacterium]